MQALQPSWTPDPNDPRAPRQEIWDALSPEHRVAVTNALPSSWEVLPEGDLHRETGTHSEDTLKAFFRVRRRDAYVGVDLAVYYPDVQRFAPDLFVVLDVEQHHRERWVVSAEGRGLDFVVEVLVHGDRRKDLAANVELYSSLGIPEYYVYEPLASRLHAFRLPSPGARRYEKVLAQQGVHFSAVLGLELMIIDGRLRFMVDSAVLPTTGELNARLNKVVDELTQAAEEEAQRAEAEAQRAEAEAQRADAAEARAREAEARAQALAARLRELGMEE